MISILRTVLDKIRGDLPINKWAYLKILQEFPVQNANWKDDFWMQKIANSCILGPILQAILDKWGCLPISTKWINFKISQQFSFLNPNWKVRFMNKIAIMSKPLLVPEIWVQIPAGPLLSNSSWYLCEANNTSLWSSN